MEKMGVSQEALAALDRLQSTNQLHALYKPSGDPMAYKTAVVTPVFQQSATLSATAGAPALAEVIPPTPSPATSAVRIKFES